MPNIQSNPGSVFYFSTKNNSTDNIIQIAGSEQIFPYAYYNNVIFAGNEILTNNRTITSCEGPLFVNALSYNVNVLRDPGNIVTHSIADLQTWSGSYSYTNAGSIGGGMYECVGTSAGEHFLIDLTSSISTTNSIGIPRGTSLIFYLNNNGAASHLRLTGSFFNNKTLLESTEDGASVTIQRSARNISKWYIQSIVGTWTIT